MIPTCQLFLTVVLKKCVYVLSKTNKTIYFPKTSLALVAGGISLRINPLTILYLSNWRCVIFFSKHIHLVVATSYIDSKIYKFRPVINLVVLAS